MFQQFKQSLVWRCYSVQRQLGDCRHHPPFMRVVATHLDHDARGTPPRRQFVETPRERTPNRESGAPEHSERPCALLENVLDLPPSS